MEAVLVPSVAEPEGDLSPPGLLRSIARSNPPLQLRWDKRELVLRSSKLVPPFIPRYFIPPALMPNPPAVA